LLKKLILHKFYIAEYGGYPEAPTYKNQIYKRIKRSKERHHASVHYRGGNGGNRGSDFGGSGFGRGDLRRPAPAEWQMLVLGKALVPE
jgi:hypothetical protein